MSSLATHTSSFSPHSEPADPLALLHSLYSPSSLHHRCPLMLTRATANLSFSEFCHLINRFAREVVSKSLIEIHSDLIAS